MFPRLWWFLCPWCLCLQGPVQATDDPRLSSTQSGGGVVLSWPVAARGWVLERSMHLREPAPWVRVPSESYRADATSRFVEMPAREAAQFFRLRQSGPPVPGLTGIWELNEGDGRIAEEAGGLGPPLQLVKPEWSRGRGGSGALRFNGGAAGAGGNHARLSNAGHRFLPPPGLPFSISIWFSREPSEPGWSGLAGTEGSGGGGWQILLGTSGEATNEIVFAATGVSGAVNLRARAILLPGTWHELVATYDGSAANLYLDGVWLARGRGHLVTDEETICVGGGVGKFNSFRGRIDELRTYARALGSEELGLAGHWRFDEGAGRLGADSSVHGRHARLAGASSWAAGRAGGAIWVGAGAEIPNADQGVVPPTGSPFSISFWLRPRALAAGRSALMRSASGSNSGWNMTIETEPSGGGRLRFESLTTGGTLDFRFPVGLTNGVWTKLDVTFNGGVATGYVNGLKAGSGFGAIRGGRAPLEIGRVDGLPAFDGTLDELRVYRGERDEAEIGPVARPTSQMVMVQSLTNVVLPGGGPAGRPLTFALVPGSGPTNGTILSPPGLPVVTYRAGARKGPDRFAYTVSDGEFTSPPAIVSLSVVEPHWLSPVGGPIQPRDGTSPERAWAAGSADALDAIWRTNRYYDCFFYAPGDYETRGWKYLERSTLHAGCKHIGSGSTGSGRTTIRLVDVWSAWQEGYIFGTWEGYTFSEDFEVHDLVLDCNAEQVPMYALGEPVWLRIPLAAPALVDAVRVEWGKPTPPWQGGQRIGHPAEFSLRARRSGADVLIPRSTAVSSSDRETRFELGVMADELVVDLRRRGDGVDYYGISEVEVSGGALSLPEAKVPGGGRSQLDAEHAVLLGFDGNTGTAWASGPEAEVELTLPLRAGTVVDHLEFLWNCQAVPWAGRFGPAARFEIRARDEVTGEYFEVSHVSQGREASGRERVSLGPDWSGRPLATDRLAIRLLVREADVDFYSFREVRLGRGSVAVSLLLPEASSSFGVGTDRGALGAVDANPATQWASGTQGMVGAVVASGNNLKFTRLKVMGFGTKAGRECFPMFLVPGSWRQGYHFGNVLLEDCLFTEPAPANRDGLTVIDLHSNPPNVVTNAVVRRTTVASVRDQFTYSHAFAASHVEDCLVEGCAVGVYFEPDPGNIDDVGPVLVRSNRFVNVDAGVYLYNHPGAQFDSLTCVGNEFVLRETGGYAVSVCDVCGIGPSPVITNVALLNNVVRYPGWVARPSSLEGGFLSANMQHLITGNNLVGLGTAHGLRVRQYPVGFILPPAPVIDCDHPGPFASEPGWHPPSLDVLPPGYRRAWFNNRDLSGALIEVRFLNEGIDRPASQQQWRE